MGNSVSGRVGNYVIVRPLQVGNSVIADIPGQFIQTLQPEPRSEFFMIASGSADRSWIPPKRITKRAPSAAWASTFRQTVRSSAAKLSGLLWVT
jgi:hypothetical protein